MGFPPVRKDLEGLMADTRERLVDVERRMGRLPNRLRPTGEQVTDWNNATETGWYWSDGSALNNPVGNVAVGQVLVKPTGTNPRIMQIVYFPTATDSLRRREWRRIKALDTGNWGNWVLMNDDSGWVNITSGFASGFTTGSTPGQLAYRVKDDIVYWRGGVNGTLPSGAYTTVVTGLPAACRPPGTSDGQPYRTGAAFSGATPGIVEFHSGGSIVLGQSSGANKAWGAFTASYPKD